MAVKRVAETDQALKPNMTPLIDVTFLLITFFIMIMTIAKDEAAQRINLPVARMAPVLEDDQIPNSISINVAYLEKQGKRAPYLLGWGLEVNLETPGGFDQFRKVIRNEGALQKQREISDGTYDKKEGLTTTVIVRVDEQVDYGIFRKVMQECRQAGFTKFQLKAAEKEDKSGQAA
jgi:biopolymer transport protein ExbD